MRFVVDGMLGGLARWLRMLGHVVNYDSNRDDNSLLRIANEQGMILLTRDEELYNRAQARNIPSLLVMGETEERRLGYLAKALDISLDIDMAETKCPECGSELIRVSQDEVSNAVPVASLKKYSKFWKCANSDCGKVYWVGSHWKQIRQTLEEARRVASLRE